MTDSDLNNFIVDVTETGHRIENIDKLIQQLDKDDLKSRYTKEMLDLIEQYNVMCEMLEYELEKHIETDRKNGNNTINLTYVKVLKQLKSKIN